jgi:hypothetical protein
MAAFVCRIILCLCQWHFYHIHVVAIEWKSSCVPARFELVRILGRPTEVIFIDEGHDVVNKLQMVGLYGLLRLVVRLRGTRPNGTFQVPGRQRWHFPDARVVQLGAISHDMLPQPGQDSVFLHPVTRKKVGTAAGTPWNKQYGQFLAPSSRNGELRTENLFDCPNVAYERLSMGSNLRKMNKDLCLI